MRNKAKYRLRTLYIIHCALLCIMLCGCRPRGVLSSSEMRSVLHDLHHAEAVLQVAGYNYGHDEAVAKYYQQILDDHGITQAQFDSSLVWYNNGTNRKTNTGANNRKCYHKVRNAGKNKGIS